MIHFDFSPNPSWNMGFHGRDNHHCDVSPPLASPPSCFPIHPPTHHPSTHPSDPGVRLPGWKSFPDLGGKQLTRHGRGGQGQGSVGAERRGLTPNWSLRGGCTSGATTALTIMTGIPRTGGGASAKRSPRQSWPVDLGLVPGTPPRPRHPDLPGPGLYSLLCSLPWLSPPLSPDPSIPTCYLSDVPVPRATLLDDD